MAKPKSSKGPISVPNKSLHCRLSYLYQAASYLGSAQVPTSPPPQTLKDEKIANSSKPDEEKDKRSRHTTAFSQTPLRPASRRLISDIRSVSLKAQLRMSPAMKSSMCKNCDTLLIDGATCSNEVENKSKQGKKPWADVLVRKCNTCGMEKRFPLSETRQKRRPRRQLQDQSLGEDAPKT